MHLNNTIRNLINQIGLDIHRFNPRSKASFRLAELLRDFHIDLVFDIGANVGQFSAQLRSSGYDGHLVSFEPLSTAHQILSEAASTDSRWLVHSRAAIGDRDGELQIHIAGNSVSSSLLPMLESHSSAAEDSAYVDIEKTPVFRLDSVASTYLKNIHRPFLKIDTQGYEWQVLDGAVELLPHIQGIHCELSLVPLYDGQHLWIKLIERLEREGFALWSIETGFCDPRNKRTLQVDATFFRT